MSISIRLLIKSTDKILNLLLIDWCVGGYFFIVVLFHTGQFGLDY